MKQLIEHYQREDQYSTFGIVTTVTGQFLAHLLTLKWRDNVHGNWETGSCIPPGWYTMIPHVWGLEAAKDKRTWLATDPQNSGLLIAPDGTAREGILRHPANVAMQLHGCTAYGTGLANFGYDFEEDRLDVDSLTMVPGVTGSRDALDSVARYLGDGDVQAGYMSTWLLQVVSEINQTA